MRRGLTIIELIIVVAIIGLIFSASMISFSGIAGKKLEADSRKILMDICWARERAVALHLNHIVSFDIVNDIYMIYEDSDGDSIPDTNEELKKQVIEAGVDLVSFTDFSPAPVLPSQIIFNFPKGNAQDRILTLSSQGKTRTVYIYGDSGYAKIP